MVLVSRRSTSYLSLSLPQSAPYRRDTTVPRGGYPETLDGCRYGVRAAYWEASESQAFKRSSAINDCWGRRSPVSHGVHILLSRCGGRSAGLNIPVAFAVIDPPHAPPTFHLRISKLHRHPSRVMRLMEGDGRYVRSRANSAYLWRKGFKLASFPQTIPSITTTPNTANSVAHCTPHLAESSHPTPSIPRARHGHGNASLSIF